VEPTLRPARPGDKEAILAFTRETWSWGDYLERVYDAWLADPAAHPVAAEVGGEVVGFARGSLPSAAESWAQGLRVHPGHRGRGLGTALMRDLMAWSGAAGARVMRLSVWEEHVLGFFATLGFHSVGEWLAGWYPSAPGGPNPRGNGAKRVPARQRLTPVPAAEADAAMLAWAGGPLERAAHGLFPVDWAWRRLNLGDLEAAAGRRALWQAPSGWALAEVDEDAFAVTWLCTYPEEAPALLRALHGAAAAAGVERLELQVPALGWLGAALEQDGWHLQPLRVLARPLP
jgi:GNAT superfamily N-acetyltransferase